MLRFKLREVLSCFVVGLMMIVAIKLVLGDGVEDEDVFDVFLDDEAGLFGLRSVHAKVERVSGQ